MAMDWPVCLEAHEYLMVHLWQLIFSIFATPNIDMFVSFLHKIYSIQRSVTHMKSQSVEYGHLHPENAAKPVMVASYE